MLVEDNPGDVKVIYEMLNDDEKHKYYISNSNRLDESIKKLITEKFDIILLDLGLPDSEGMDTFDIMKYNAPEIPIIVLTGFKEDILEVCTVGKGAKDYLVKDELKKTLLINSIQEALMEN